MNNNENKTKKYYVDQNSCVGCGMCYSTFPNLFEAQQNGLSKEKNNGIITEQNESDVNKAIDICPFGAIKKM